MKPHLLIAVLLGHSALSANKERPSRDLNLAHSQKPKRIRAIKPLWAKGFFWEIWSTMRAQSPMKEVERLLKVASSPDPRPNPGEKEATSTKTPSKFVSSAAT